MNRRILVLLATMATVALLLFQGLAMTPVSAQGIPRLAGQITDQTGDLAGSTAQVTAALDRLQGEQNVQLWVLFVDTTGGSTVTDYATEVARSNSLGANDALLVVAVGDRTDAIWLSDGLDRISNAEVNDIIGREVEPRLAGGDFPGAVVAAADGLLQAAGGTVTGPTPPAGATPAPNQEQGGGAGGGSGSSGLSLVLVIIIAVVAAIVLYVVFVRIMQARRGRAVAEERDRQTGELAKQANRQLIETDDALKDAQQEAGFAEAQFGEETAKPFRDALEAAAAELKAAFSLRQQLDDATPEDPPTRERMLREIIAHCEKARALVSEQEASIKSLRDLQKTAPDVLRQLPDQAAVVEARLPGAEEKRGALERYSPANWQAVAGNVTEVRKRLEFVKSETARGTAAVTAGDVQAAALAARGAQVALAQAGTLLDAVERLSAALDQARDGLPALVADAESDVGAARQSISAGQVSPDLAAGVAAAERLLASAKAAASATPPDVLAAQSAATQAHNAANQALAGIREAVAQRAREKAALDNQMRSAEAAIGRSNDYIETRRGGVGREARTRLAEAQRHWDEARAAYATDPARASQEARQAERMAGEAYGLAQSDFDQYDRGRRGGGGPDVGSAILGAIIGGMIMGGGRGGGFGGTHWGSPGGSGGFGRSIGGGFGGGGGRVSGGRW